MSHNQFTARVAADTLGGGIVLLLLALVGATAPMWIVAVLLLGLVPLTVVGVLAGLIWSARRQDRDFQLVRPVEAVADAAPTNPTEPNWDWPAHTAGPFGAGRISSDRPAPISFPRDLKQA